VSIVQLGDEESQYEDLLLFMKLLSFLTTKDYLDMAPKEEGEKEGQGGSGVGVEALQVVMEGIRIVLNIITEDLLKVSLLVGLAGWCCCRYLGVGLTGWCCCRYLRVGLKSSFIDNHSSRASRQPARG